MLDRGLDQFKGKRVLLLQGPVGPFFTRWAEDLRQAGAQVFKVNFNAGDWFYYHGTPSITAARWKTGPDGLTT